MLGDFFLVCFLSYLLAYSVEILTYSVKLICNIVELFLHIHMVIGRGEYFLHFLDIFVGNHVAIIAYYAFYGINDLSHAEIFWRSIDVDFIDFADPVSLSKTNSAAPTAVAQTGS